ncbi:MAG: AIPR family protein, partial [Fibromonadales bacterium]|nr:AIPR family protein [Fibromonadales bacterium]
MEFNKAFDRRLDFIAKYRSLDKRVPLEKKKALHYLNQQKGCFHAFQYTNKILELFIFLDEENSIETSLSYLSSDLKNIGDVLLRTANPTNPFFLAIREEVPTWHVASVLDTDTDDIDDFEDDCEQKLEITVMRTDAGKDITDYEMRRTLKDLKKRLKSWREELHIIADISAEFGDMDDNEAEDAVLRLSLENAPLRIKSKRGELFVGFVPIMEIYNYHLELGRRHKAKHNMMIVSSNIRTYLGSQTYTNASLLDAFLGMRKNGTLEEFPFLHNGMTLTGDNLRPEQIGGRWYLSIDHPKIINGAQSLFTYEQYASREDEPVNPLVLVKVVIPYPSENEEHESGNFVRLVTMANNRQNPVFSYH